MQFNLSSESSTDSFAEHTLNHTVYHPLSIGNEFMPHPIHELSEESQKDFQVINQYAELQN